MLSRRPVPSAEALPASHLPPLPPAHYCRQVCCLAGWQEFALDLNNGTTNATALSSRFVQLVMEKTYGGGYLRVAAVSFFADPALSDENCPAGHYGHDSAACPGYAAAGADDLFATVCRRADRRVVQKDSIDIEGSREGV